ncbi:hypothetical protein [Methylosinus sp. LW4]|nr:hypothetical protein [Methylosinus sp. LW4]
MFVAANGDARPSIHASIFRPARAFRRCVSIIDFSPGESPNRIPRDSP